MHQNNFHDLSNVLFFFLNWKSYAGFPNVWSFDREKSALAEKHGSEWKMLEFISFCAIYSLPIWFFPWWISCIRIHFQKNRLNCSRVDISMPSIALIWITAASISPRGFITFLFFFYFKISTIQFIVICTYVYIHIL